MTRYVQYGCGFSSPDGWINFDSSPTLRFERVPLLGKLYTMNTERFPRDVRYGNVVTGLPIESESCDGVYASHVLEHLCLDDCRIALAETFRILAPDGTFRAVVPDLLTYAARYVARAADGNSEASHQFMTESCLGVSRRARSPFAVARRLLGHSAHLWMWDEFSLRAELETAGFRSVRRAEYGDCDDPRFHDVEDAERFIDACAIEARR